MKSQQTCPICDTVSPYLLTKDSYDFYRCSGCALVFVWPAPNLEFLGQAVYSKQVGYQGNKAKDLSQSPLPGKQAPILEALVVAKPGGRLLDIGCSNGQFMYWARERGLNPVGVELNSGTAEIAQRNGLEVFIGTLDQAHFPDQSFDLIFLGDLIEHVSDPRMIIKECQRLLSPGGFLAIITPNLDCFWSKSTWQLYRWFKIPWASLTPPHHLCQFSTGNLSQLLASEGFSIERTWYHGPGLKYELGMTHLWGAYKRSRKFGALIYALFAYTLYTLLFSGNYLMRYIRRTDFGLVLIAKKI
ncbi:MAG: class I SAM-dependent methyltransferase [Patescibacteria group bacterium]